MNGERGGWRCESGVAVHAVIHAVGRNARAWRQAAAYSAVHRKSKRNQPKGPTMKTISTQVRMTSLLLAVVTSAVVLGSTVTGLQSGSVSPSVVVMEKVTVKPSALN